MTPGRVQLFSSSRYGQVVGESPHRSEAAHVISLGSQAKQARQGHLAPWGG